MHKLLKNLDEKNIKNVHPGDSLMIEDEGTYEFAVFLYYNVESGEVNVLDYALNEELLNTAVYPLHRCLTFDAIAVVNSEEYLNSIER